MVTIVNHRTDAFSGTGTLDISGQYFANMITIKNLAVGTMVVTAKAKGSDVYEDVLYGTLPLARQRTLTIEGYQLDSLKFTVTPSAAFTVKVYQYDPIL